ncbi:hypothetical protein SAMN05216405_3356 [Lachnospiraceae bacterium NLAE-zl-G231]|nr:hypothetical protein SAMN05216405_3356 [Lachnospiraceae bacterium NLAE-zl-G231]
MVCKILCILLFLIVLALAMRLFSLRRGLLLIRRDLKEINDEGISLRHLTAESPDTHLQELAGEINRYIDASFAKSRMESMREQEILAEITNISHDLRTPLTSISGYLELIGEEELSQEQKENLDVVQRRTAYLNQLIAQLYEYSRLENREFPLKQERLDITHLFKEHILASYGEFEKAGLKLTLRLTDEPLWISADENGLLRIFHNLTSNCLKYGQKEASISLECTAGQAVLTFRNPAEGFTEKDAEQIFHRFYRKDASRNAQGSGLGMSVAKLLSEQMGGRLDAQLEEGMLAIRLLLPCADKSADT